MAIQRYEYDELPPYKERAAVVEWLTFHGINARDLPIPGWIERDDDRNSIRAYAYERDARGNLVPVFASEAFKIEPKTIIIETVNEGPPLPFPAHVPYRTLESDRGLTHREHA